MKPFVHLHVHTEYSLLDGISRLPDMVAQAKAFDMPALAITDHGTMCGAVYFYKEAVKAGIKPIIGCELYVTRGAYTDKQIGRGERLYHLVLLAETEEGYENLVKLVSKASTEGFYYKPRVDRALLRAHSKGLIALSACIQGEIPRLIIEDNEAGAREALEWYIDTYGKDNFFLEIQNHFLPEEDKARRKLIDWAKEYGLGLVATNDFHYVRREDSEAQDIKICISTGAKRDEEKRMRFPNDEFYLKSGDEMAELFADVPEAIENTVRIAERCQFAFDFSTHHLPKYDVPEGETAKSYLRKLCEQNIPTHYDVEPKELRERLDYELSVIETMGFEDYFLIVWDYVDYSRKNDILVGPGRGSAAGSVVAYLLDITGLDPLRYNLLFERFLNPERVSMPDIDIDFCYENRGRAIAYVTEKYGRERVAQIITFGTEGARAVIRDVGRVLDVPLSEVNSIIKLIPNELGITLDKALQNKDLAALCENNPSVQEIFSYAKKLEGIARNASTHAAGVVIAAAPLDEHVPLQNANDGNYVTQYDKDNIEELGLLKMDFLGLRTLTVLGDALALIKKNHGVDIDLNKLPLDDKAACELLCKGDTAGVFQLESEGITKLVMDLKPEGFEDLIPLVALYRPGPLGSGMVEDFIKRRHGEREVTYLHPLLEPILRDTFGVILYQEQVMQIASAMGGFTLGQADLLRRAMGKKKESVLLAQRESFLAGTEKNGIPSDVANEVFDLLVYFAGYGFNKSHSAAYAYIAYQTAYLKAHYFPEFMAATMSSCMGNIPKLAQYIMGCKAHGVAVLGPDVNESEASFSVGERGIRFGLGAIKQVGDGVIASLIKERESHGKYESIVDFCKRVPSVEVNKRMLESLIRCGAMDSFGLNRKQLLQMHEQAQSLGASFQKNQARGAISLFEGFDEPVDQVAIPQVSDLDEAEKLKDEKELTGFYISGHPLASYAKEMEGNFPIGKVLEQAESLDQKRVTIGGLISGKTDRMTKRNELMSIIQLEDFTGTVPVVVFPRQYQAAFGHMAVDMAVKVRGKIDADDRGVQIIAEAVAPLRPSFHEIKEIILHIRPEYDTPLVKEELAEFLKRAPGNTPLRLYVYNTRQYVSVPPAYYVDMDKDTMECLEAMLGEKAVELR